MSDLFRIAAPAYWDCGLSVVPLEHGSKRPAKELTGWQGYCNGPASPTVQSAWMTKYAMNGIGLLLSTPISDGAGVGAIDVDDDRCVRLAHAILGRCPSRKRGRKGETIFVAVRNDQPIRSTVLHDYQKAQKVDVLFNGKMTVLPPSRHPETGEPYIWLGIPLLDCDFADLPILTPGKLDLLRFVLRAEQTAALMMAESTHDAGMNLVWRLVERGHDDTLIAEIITALLPEDYSGNSLDELPGWIESARRKIRVSQEQLPLDEEIARSVQDLLAPLVFIGEAFVRITGGDPIAVRKLYQEVEGRVVPSVRFAGSMNLNIPPSMGAADALRRRLIFLMCGERIAMPDRNRDSALQAERPGIFLRWMIALDRLMRRGEFDIPESSTAEVREYTTTQDAVSIFLAERLVVDPNAATLIPDIVRAYNEWADELQERRRAGPFLSRKLCALGVRKTWLRSERALCVRLKPLNRSERDDRPDY